MKSFLSRLIRANFWLSIGCLALALNISRAEEATNYLIAPNDLMDFRIFQESDLDAVVRISGDGTASFPLVGNMAIGGKSISDAIKILRAAYMDGYLVNPQISLTIRAYATKRFTVLGQVQKPGSYEIQGTEEVSLLQAIGMAGGYTRIANPSKVTVKRREKGKEVVLDFDAKKMARGKSDTSFMVKPGDVVTVAESIF